MEYYDNTPAKLNIKLREIPLDRTTNSQYKVIYSGINETLPKMENEFSNLKIKVKEYNKSRNSSPGNSDFINNNISYIQQNNINIIQENNLNDNLKDNNNIDNNINNLNNNNIIIKGNNGYENSNENILRTKNNNHNNINNNYDKMDIEKLATILGNKNNLINEFNELVESCYEKLKRYKEENINLKNEMEKFGLNKNEILDKNNNDEDEKEEKNNENDFNLNELPTLKKEKKVLKNKKKKSNKLKSNNNNYLNNINLYGLKQIQHLGEELNEIMIDNKNSQEKYENKLGNLINKLQNLGKKFE